MHCQSEPKQQASWKFNQITGKNQCGKFIWNWYLKMFCSCVNVMLDESRMMCYFTQGHIIAGRCDCGEATYLSVQRTVTLKTDATGADKPGGKTGRLARDKLVKKWQAIFRLALTHWSLGYFKGWIFKIIIQHSSLGTWRVSALRWVPQNLINEKSTLVQVMAWCRQAASHCLSQYWPVLCRYMASLYHNKIQNKIKI